MSARFVMAVVAAFALVGCRAIRNERLLRERDAGAATATATPPTTAEVVPAAGPVDAGTGSVGGGGSTAGTGEDPETKKRGWLTSALTGRDNNVAAFRLVRITADPTLGFKLFVKNEFGLTCGLAFGADGDPASTTTPCVGDDGWHAKEPRLSFTCSVAQGRENCHARYTLVAKEGFADPATLELVRVVPVAKP